MQDLHFEKSYSINVEYRPTVVLGRVSGCCDGRSGPEQGQCHGAGAARLHLGGKIY